MFKKYQQYVSTIRGLIIQVQNKFDNIPKGAQQIKKKKKISN